MAIAFKCDCGAAMSVPDTMAGKKGTCPKCKKAIVAPATSDPSLAARAKPSESAAKAGKVEPSFDVASRDLTGSKDLVVSGDATAEDAKHSAPKPAAPAKPAAPKQPLMRFRCPKCEKTLQIPLRLAGQSGKCAGCGGSFTAPIPEALKQARAKAAAVARANAPAPSLRDAFSVIKVRCDCGMTSSVPRARAETGDERCPACNAYLNIGPAPTVADGASDEAEIDG